MTYRTKDLVASAYRNARQAGLPTADARALADRVAQRVVLGGESLDLVQRDELARAVAPRRCVNCKEPEDGGGFGWFDGPEGLVCLACGRSPVAPTNDGGVA